MKPWFIILAPLLLSGCNTSSQSTALGTLERPRITLSSTANETITQVAVHEGEPVKQGQILMQFDVTKMQAQFDRAVAQLNQARAKLNELESGVRSETISQVRAQVNGAKSALAEAEHQLTRANALRKQNLTGEADVDAAKARRDTAKANFLQLSEQLKELSNGTRPEQIEQAKQAVVMAQANVTLAEKNLNDLTLTAPEDGFVDALPWHVGDRVMTGMTALTLLSSTRPFARVYIPAKKLSQLPLGSALEVRIDGVESSITGELRHVRSQPGFTPYFSLSERDRDALMYLSEVHFAKDNDALLSNIHSGRAVEVVLP